ncbi:hypothetical protein NL676_010849 [Syzygium grande]|nr:hypothetical protein NL676_010849 [Syzygium grande]
MKECLAILQPKTTYVQAVELGTFHFFNGQTLTSGCARLVLFTKERLDLSPLRSQRDPKEAEVLLRLECGVLMAMLTIELVVLVLRAPCAVAGRAGNSSMVDEEDVGLFAHEVRSEDEPTLMPFLA